MIESVISGLVVVGAVVYIAQRLKKSIAGAASGKICSGSCAGCACSSGICSLKKE